MVRAKAAEKAETTPKDFFLWAGAMLALYGSITSIITLLFQYINYAYPDELGYGDPYGTTMRAAMATLLVLAPTTIVLFRIIRKMYQENDARLGLWVRKWALVLTLFIAAATALIDLITIMTVFLSGELTIRFALKALVILLVAGGVFSHFVADLKGYWLQEPMRAQYIGIAFGVASLLIVIGGFLIIGSPAQARALREDQERVSDLQSIQYEIINYWQQKEELPETLDQLNDPLSWYELPLDPNGSSYEYSVTGENDFSLCATFALPTPAHEASRAKDLYFQEGLSENQYFDHQAGRQCFDRTIDPERFPPQTQS